MQSSFFKGILIRIAQALRDAFFPLKCQACGFFLESKDSYFLSASGKRIYSGCGIDEVLCIKCSADLKSPSSPMCIVCGRNLESGVSDRRCGKCIAEPPSYDSVRSAFFYEGPARRIVHAMKYRSVTRLADYMGTSLCEKMPATTFSPKIILVPVPLHSRKLRERGYNQAALIAESMCLTLHGVGKISCEFHQDILERVVNTRSQAGLHKKERLINVSNAFIVKSPEDISGRQVVLVDDVFTTGATASACAKALKNAGASEVFVFTFARVRD